MQFIGTVGSGVRRAALTLIPARAVRGLGVAGLVGALGVAASHAQVQDAPEPYYITVVADQTPLRSGDRTGFYPVATLPAGQVLLCDGENSEWRRVAYPARTPVYVNAGLVRHDETQETATLSVPSGLKAANQNAGMRGSWKPVFDPPLQPGVVFRVVEFEDHETERFRGYRILAPEGARGYVAATAVRRATAEEVQAHQERLSELRGRGIPIPEDGLRAPSSDNDRRAEAQPAARAEPEREVEPAAEPDETSPPAGRGGEPVRVIDPRERGAEPEEPTERRIAEFEELEAAFEKVRAQPDLEAEYGELIAEFGRTLESIPDTEVNRPLRVSLQQRLEILALLRDVQARKRTMEESRRSIDERSAALAERLAEIEQTRRYVVIGRLTTSTVYDGKNLPLMYRIQSVHDRLPRTLGYLKPDPKLNLEAKVGRVVGVEGRAAVDGALKLNVVSPTRVDVLTAREDGPSEDR